MFEVPLPGELPFFNIRVRLSGSEYVFDFRYNQREDRYYLTLQNQDGEPLVSGFKVVCNVPIGRKSARVDLPLGKLIFQDETTSQEPARYGDLGERVKLYYYEPETL